MLISGALFALSFASYVCNCIDKICSNMSGSQWLNEWVNKEVTEKRNIWRKKPGLEEKQSIRNNGYVTLTGNFRTLNNKWSRSTRTLEKTQQHPWKLFHLDNNSKLTYLIQGNFSRLRNFLSPKHSIPDKTSHHTRVCWTSSYFEPPNYK